MSNRRLALIVLGVCALVFVSTAWYIGSQPCDTTMCFDWGTTSPTERARPGVTGGIWYGAIGAVAYTPLLAAPLIAVIVVVSVKRRRNP